MAPPGRRKVSFMRLVPLIVLFLFTTAASAASAVLGIDLGSGYIKAAIAKPGAPIDVVLTKDSRRKEAATIAFKPSRAQSNDPEAFPERLYGTDAVALTARYPSDVYAGLKSLLGLPRYSDPVQEYTARYPGLSVQSVSRYSQGNTRGTVGFKSQNFGKEDSFMVEELLAMQLKNIKANAEVATGKGSAVTDVVVTYPAFYTAEEKRALELAVDLAGMRLLGMISDGLAVGLNYATTRTFGSVSEGAQPEYHLVYDMGAGSTTATVLKFQGRTIKDFAKRNKTIQEVQVVGTGYDRTFGGDQLNDLIVNDMINQFVEQDTLKRVGLEPVHVKGDKKSMARLLKDAEKVRQVLSANSLATASFEGLYYEDNKFKYSISRDHFERLAKSHAPRVTTPITTALDAGGVTLDQLDSIILHGGAVRTPFVQKQIERLAGAAKKIKTNVNADEAAVMGAAFKAAGLSPSFRVKEIRASDVSGTAITMKWTSEGKERQQKLFTPMSPIGAEKQVPIKTLDSVTLQFYQSVNDADVLITEFDASNITKSVGELKEKYGCAPINITTTFAVRLSPVDGLPEVISGSVSCHVNSTKAGTVIANVKGFFGFGSKDQAPLDGEGLGVEDEPTLTPLPLSDPTSSGSTMTSSSPSDSAASSASSKSSSLSSSSSKASKAAKATPSIVNIPIALQSTVLGLNNPPSAQMPNIRQRLSQFDSSDRNLVLRSEALNTLEAFTYRARDYLTDESFIAFSSKAIRSELEKQLSAASEWLYGDGIDAKTQDFKDRLKSLKALVQPVLTRRDEGGKREGAVKALQDGLETMTAMLKMVEGNIEIAAKEAAASASSAASSVAERATSAVLPSSSDPAEELDEDPYKADVPPVEKDIPLETPKPYEYTPEDLSSMQKAYGDAQTWLDEKLALQQKLGPYDDPAVLVADLEAKATQLQTTASNILMKSIRMHDAPKKAKAAKKDKTKLKKTKAKANSNESTSATSSIVEATSTVVATKSKKDEL